MPTIYYSLRVTKLPLVVEVEFPESEEGRDLAKIYRKLIRLSKKPTKSLDQGRRVGDHVVALELPSSVRDVSYSRTYSTLVLHFKTQADAEKFRDPLFCAVPHRARQLIMKASWAGEGRLSLKQTLSSKMNELDLVSGYEEEDEKEEDEKEEDEKEEEKKEEEKKKEEDEKEEDEKEEDENEDDENEDYEYEDDENEDEDEEEEDKEDEDRAGPSPLGDPTIVSRKGFERLFQKRR
ncbi:hypothetical protein V8F20_003818 [Naviculisporaceae sp. PSN 640]